MTRITLALALLLGALALGCGNKEEGKQAAPEAAEPAEPAPEEAKPAEPEAAAPETAEAGEGEDADAEALPTAEDFEGEAVEGITEKNLEKELAEIEKALEDE